MRFKKISSSYSEGSKPIDDGLALVDLMAAKELKIDSLVPLQEITRQIGSVAGHVSGDETLLKKWKVICHLKLCSIYSFRIKYEGLPILLLKLSFSFINA